MVFELLPSTVKDHRNVLYFCTFDRSSSMVGKEILLAGNGRPIEARNERDIGRMFQIVNESTYRIFPLVVPFDFASTLYPNLDATRAGLPYCISFEPEVSSEGMFVREPGEIRKGIGHEFRDRGIEDKIQEVKGRIQSGELLQVVLSRRFNLPDLSPAQLIKKFLHQDTSRYVFYFRTDGMEIAGSSPENLITRNGNRLEISTIAGTVRRSEDVLEDQRLSQFLENSEKDRLEHRMLVDLARNDLGKISVPGSVRVLSSMKVKKFNSVQHLVSLTGSILKLGFDNLNIVRAIFPAGTVSGAPKERALRLISEYEDFPRGLYSGAIGTMSVDNLDLALMIRSVFSVGSRVYAQAGAGIVKDSDPAKEVQEMFDKVLSVSGGVLSENVDYR